MSLIWITNAKYIIEYQIELEFNNNKKGIVDFKNLLDKKIFEPLKETNTFKNFKLNSWTIEWENGADFSPEFLLENIEE
jgi:uncharacterized protein YjbK